MAGCHLCHDSKDFDVARGPLFCAVVLVCFFIKHQIVQEWRASNLTDHVFFLIRFIRPPGIVLCVDKDTIPPRLGLLYCCLGRGRREEEHCTYLRQLSSENITHGLSFRGYKVVLCNMHVLRKYGFSTTANYNLIVGKKLCILAAFLHTRPQIIFSCTSLKPHCSHYVFWIMLMFI